MMTWESIKIIVFSILAACVYGIAHDFVTAHVCVEYFLPPVHPIRQFHVLMLTVVQKTDVWDSVCPASDSAAS